jgi:phosphatidylglycerophosphatase A
MQAATPLGPPIARPTLRFLFASPWHLLALGFGSGLPSFAPGTWGTLAGWAAFVALDRWLDPAGWLAAMLLLFFLGALAAQRTGEALGVADSGHIVVDEILAIWIVLLMLPHGHDADGWLAALAFVIFRAFDIVKPPPIRWLDRRMKNGTGVMLDDLLAAFYTLLVLALAVRLGLIR